MATTTTTSGTVVFSNSGAAAGDTFTSTSTGLTEDNLQIVCLDVTANDGGGTKTVLWSLDNGISSLTYATSNNGGSGVSAPTDLLTQDTARTECLSSDCSLNGAKIWITADGKVGYDATKLSDTFKAQLQTLHAGETLTDTFTYAIRLSNGTLSWTTAKVEFLGTNDSASISGNAEGALNEDTVSPAAGTLTVNDADSGENHAQVASGLTAKGSWSVDADGHWNYTVNHAAENHLAAGVHDSDSFTVYSQDGTASKLVTVDILGVNDAASISGTDTGTLTEDSVLPATGSLSVSDADDGDGHTQAASGSTAKGSWSVDGDGHWSYTVNNAAENHLAAGVHDSDSFTVFSQDSTASKLVTIDILGVNDAPTITSNGGGATASVSIAENMTAVADVNATDPDDGATQTYSILHTAGTDFAKFAIDPSTGVLSFVSAPDYENPQDVGGTAGDNAYVVDVQVSDGLGGIDTQTITVNINDVNEFAVSTPVDSDAASNAVNENVIAGTVVGITAFASDADATNNTVSYSLTSNPGGLFAIDATTGVVTTAAAIDREAIGPSTSIQVTATSSDGSTAAQTFSITINDVNEFAVSTPVDSDAASNAVNENVIAGTVVGITAFASDADATNNTVSYSLTSNPGGLFAIDATTGVVTTAAAIDREAIGPSTSIQVTATSSDGSTAAQTFSITINDVNEFAVSTPVDSDAASNAVNENVIAGTVVGITAFASDADATNNTVSYSLTSNPGGLFAIDATTGVVTTAAAIDREAIGPSTSIQVTATSSDGSTAAQTFSITINDVNEFAVSTPVDSDAASNAVNENVIAGTVVGITAFASDADATNNTVSYSLTSNPGGLFAIDATTGVVTTAAAIDREAIGPSTSIQVTATSSDGSTAAQTFSITINDVNEFAVSTPVDSDAASNAVNENVIAGTVVGITAFASDADATNNTVSYSLTSNPGGLFAIDATTGVVTTAAAIDREAIGPSTSIQVTATSSDGSTAAQTFSITINDVNEAPTITSGATASTAENVLTSTAVYTAAASDPEGTTLTYSFGGGADDGKFNIDSSTGAVTFKVSPDFEAPTDSGSNNVYDIIVKASDGSLFDTKAVAITVTNVNEAPTVTSGTTASTPENVSTATAVYTAAATDPEGTTLTYSFGGGVDDGKFNIDSSTGAVTFKVSPDFEAPTDNGGNNVYDIIVKASDGSLFDTKAVAISVTNVNEAPTATVDITAIANDSGTAGDFITNDTSLTVSGTNSALNAGDVVQVSNNGGASWNPVTQNTGTTWSYVDGTTHSTSFTYQARIINGVNVGLNTDSQAVTIDTTADTVANHGSLAVSGTGTHSGSTVLTESVTVTGIDSDITSGTITITDTHGDSATHTLTAGEISTATSSPTGSVTVTTWINLNTLKANDTLTATVSVTDLAGNTAIASHTVTDPAGVAGSPINLGLTAPTAGQLVTVTIADLPSGWSIAGATQNADSSWTVQTTDVSTLTVTTPSNYAGAEVLHVTESWTDANGTAMTMSIADNVEAYAPGNPIFAWSGDDFLTGSAGADLFVFSQPIGNDMVYSFDATQDQIDLIGYAGFTAFADMTIADDVNGNAVVDLGAGQSITLDGVSAASLSASNFAFEQTPVVNNAGMIAIGDGAMLPLSGVVDNSGIITLDSAGAGAELELIQHGITLQGGGQIVMSDDAGNVIMGTAPDVILTNVDNIISGAGAIGAGQLTLINQGTIVADGANALVIDTGANAVLNTGLLDAEGSGGLIVASALTGSGTAQIGGTSTLEFGAASSANTVFTAAAAGMLKLDDSFHFSGTIAGFNDDDQIDLADLHFANAPTLAYVADASGMGGTLSISDGVTTAHLALLGQYNPTGFLLAGDNTGGTIVTYDHLL